MEKSQNLERVNLILNEVGQYIVGTLGQYSLDWDYACFVNSNTLLNPKGEFYLFHSNASVGFKSAALNKILFELFEHYQEAMNLKLGETKIKYVIRNSDLKSDIKIDVTNSMPWAKGEKTGDESVFSLLVKDSFR